MLGQAMEIVEPRERNSNLFPVKAKGRCGSCPLYPLLRSGSTWTPVSSFLALHTVVSPVVFDGLQYAGELISQKNGDNGGRRLVGAQAVVISGGRYGDAQQILIFIHSLHHGGQEEQKLHVFVWALAGIQQVLTSVRGEGPVVVLAAAVDPVKWFFVKQADQPVAGGYIFHGLHGELVVVGCDVGGSEDGGQFMLRRSSLVVLCLGKDAQLPKLFVQFFHKGRNPGLDGAEVMVFQLLPLGAL